MAEFEINGQWLDTLCRSIVQLVRRKGPDLSARQLAIFLACYLDREAYTVRGLAAKLNASKPDVRRALDRLMEFDLVRRKDDPSDRHSIVVQRTQAGLRFRRELGRIVQEASAAGTRVKGQSAGGMATISNFALRLPSSLMEEVKVLATQDAVSVNQFLVQAAAEKVAILKARGYSAEQTGRSVEADLESVLANRYNYLDSQQ